MMEDYGRVMRLWDLSYDKHLQILPVELRGEYLKKRTSTGTVPIKHPRSTVVFTPLYRTAEPQNFAAGSHEFRIVTGEADQNYFFPALFLAGDFAVRNAQVAPRTDGKVGFGSLADAGYPNFIGQATWRAEVTAWA